MSNNLNKIIKEETITNLYQEEPTIKCEEQLQKTITKLQQDQSLSNERAKKLEQKCAKICSDHIQRSTEKDKIINNLTEKLALAETQVVEKDQSVGVWEAMYGKLSREVAELKTGTKTGCVDLDKRGCPHVEIIDLDSDDEPELKKQRSILGNEISDETFLDSAESKTWMFGTAFRKALHDDDELCMKAVCVLYRRQLSSSKSESEESSNGWLSHFDAMGGRSLAEYLISGNSENKLSKTMSEVKENRPDVVDLCRRLASAYYAQLFSIYCKREDPFFKSG